MTIAMLYWVIFIVGVIFGAYRGYSTREFPFENLFILVLLFLLGLGTFGSPIK